MRGQTRAEGIVSGGSGSRRGGKEGGEGSMALSAAAFKERSCAAHSTAHGTSNPCVAQLPAPPSPSLSLSLCVCVADLLILGRLICLFGLPK